MLGSATRTSRASASAAPSCATMPRQLRAVRISSNRVARRNLIGCQPRLQARLLFNKHLMQQAPLLGGQPSHHLIQQARLLGGKPRLLLQPDIACMGAS
jgi:hypothetical protein